MSDLKLGIGLIGTFSFQYFNFSNIENIPNLVFYLLIRKDLLLSNRLSESEIFRVLQEYVLIIIDYTVYDLAKPACH